MEKSDNWIFFLKLENELTSDFITLDQEFKKYGRSLVPITLPMFIEALKGDKAADIVIVVKSYREFKYFNSRVKKIFKYLMRAERINIYIVSSFSTINDPALMRKGFYHFMKLPVKVSDFCYNVVSEIEEKERALNKWPGGVRPRLGLVG